MVNCSKCEKKSVFNNPNLCKDHYLEYFENKVKEGIISEEIKGKVCVAISGGKDSTTVLYLLHKNKINVEALLIDEGIKGYRDLCLIDTKKFCKELGVKLNIVSFEKEFGIDLDEIVKNKKHSCKYCGVLRRFLLNKYSKNYDMLATGHNLDDESQAAIMNLLTARKELLPSLKRDVEGLTRRVKPLKYCTEKEVLAYSFLKNFSIDFNECPNLNQSQRKIIRDALNSLSNSTEIKTNILKKYETIKIDKQFKKNYCKTCGNPTKSEVCNACKIIEEVKEL